MGCRPPPPSLSWEALSDLATGALRIAARVSGLSEALGTSLLGLSKMLQDALYRPRPASRARRSLSDQQEVWAVVLLGLSAFCRGVQGRVLSCFPTCKMWADGQSCGQFRELGFSSRNDRSGPGPHKACSPSASRDRARGGAGLSRKVRRAAHQ